MQRFMGPPFSSLPMQSGAPMMGDMMMHGPAMSGQLPMAAGRGAFPGGMAAAGRGGGLLSRLLGGASAWRYRPSSIRNQLVVDFDEYSTSSWLDTAGHADGTAIRTTRSKYTSNLENIIKQQ